MGWALPWGSRCPFLPVQRQHGAQGPQAGSKGRDLPLPLAVGQCPTDPAEPCRVSLPRSRHLPPPLPLGLGPHALTKEAGIYPHSRRAFCQCNPPPPRAQKLMPRRPANPLRNARQAWEQAALSGPCGAAVLAVAVRGGLPGPAPARLRGLWGREVMQQGRWAWRCHAAVLGVKESGARGWFSAKQRPQPCQQETGGDAAGSVELTMSVCCLRCLVPSSALGSHGLQRGRDLGAESRFSATAAHPGPLSPCLAPPPPPPQPHPPSPTASPAQLSPCLGAWLGCQARVDALIPPWLQCSFPCLSPTATLGAPGIAPQALPPLSYSELLRSEGSPSE